jgi:Protein of unknown function (DUF4254)
MIQFLKSADIVAFHDAVVGAADWPARFSAGVWATVEDNHRQNCLLWTLEDLARRKRVPDAEIADNKRAIDNHNQRRNNAIEHIDEFILGLLKDVRKGPEARLNSETPGSMMDRLSILSLKIHHMRLQIVRTDVDQGHRDSCAVKLGQLIEQRTDLAHCLDQLLEEAVSGKSFFKIYRQFKMYNDPALNPAIYGEQRPEC